MSIRAEVHISKVLYEPSLCGLDIYAPESNAKSGSAYLSVLRCMRLNLVASCTSSHGHILKYILYQCVSPTSTHSGTLLAVQSHHDCGRLAYSTTAPRLLTSGPLDWA